MLIIFVDHMMHKNVNKKLMTWQYCTDMGSGVENI